MSEIIVSGTIVLALPVQTGVSQKTGNQWSRASYVIEHESGQYPKRLVFDVKDAKIQEFALAIGQQVTVHINADCHEWPENSGKWFNNLTAWKIERAGQQQYAQQGYQQPVQQGYQPMPQQGYQPQPMPQPMAQQPVQQPMQQGQFQQQNTPFQPQQLPFPPAQ